MHPNPYSVYLDNNVWDLFFEIGLDLSVELPKEQFCLCLTREAEFEIPPIPPEKTALRDFIRSTIDKCSMATRPYFGFYQETYSPEDQRVAGFGQGYWASPEEITFIHQQRTRLSETIRPKTRLHKNEADISIAARSFHSVVLSLDKKTGPINDAYKNGGYVVFLNDFRTSGLSLREFVLDAVAKIEQRK